MSISCAVVVVLAIFTTVPNDVPQSKMQGPQEEPTASPVETPESPVLHTQASPSRAGSEAEMVNYQSPIQNSQKSAASIATFEGINRGLKRPVKRRAGMACQSCRSRKVRCDVQHRAPCTNCQLDGAKCRIAENRRRRTVKPSLKSEIGDSEAETNANNNNTISSPLESNTESESMQSCGLWDVGRHSKTACAVQHRETFLEDLSSLTAVDSKVAAEDLSDFVATTPGRSVEFVDTGIDGYDEACFGLRSVRQHNALTCECDDGIFGQFMTFDHDLTPVSLG